MNLKKLKQLLSLSVLSTSFIFSSANAMQPKVKLEKCYLSNVALYLPMSEKLKFLEVSKNTQLATLNLMTEAWEDLVELGSKRNNYNERIPIKTYDDFDLVREYFMHTDGTPRIAGFNGCMFVETIDKEMKANFFMLRAMYDIYNILHNKFRSLDDAKTIIDDCIDKIEDVTNISGYGIYRDLLATRDILNDAELSDEDKREILDADFVGIYIRYLDIENFYMIDKFNKHIGIVNRYLDLNECPYHEEMNDELKDKVLKSCIFSISGYDTQFVYPRGMKEPNDPENKKIFKIVKFLARKLEEDKCLNNCYRTFSDKKANFYNFFDFDLNMLNEDEFKNENNKNNLLDMFLRNHDNSYFTSHVDLSDEYYSDNCDSIKSYEDIVKQRNALKYIYYKYCINSNSDCINNSRIFKMSSHYPNVFDKDKQYSLTGDEILYFCRWKRQNKCTIQEIAKSFADRIKIVYDFDIEKKNL